MQGESGKESSRESMISNSNTSNTFEDMTDYRYSAVNLKPEINSSLIFSGFNLTAA